MVERKTRYLVLGSSSVKQSIRGLIAAQTRGCTADVAPEGFTHQMKRRPAVLRKNMTSDRGRELAVSAVPVPLGFHLWTGFAAFSTDVFAHNELTGDCRVSSS